MTKRLEDYMELRKKNASKDERENLLKEMTNDELDYLIDHAGTVQGKIRFASFKKTA